MENCESFKGFSFIYIYIYIYSICLDPVFSWAFLRLRFTLHGTHAIVRKNKHATLPSWNAGWNQLECTVSMKAGRVCVLFFTVLHVLHRSNPKHDYSCSWNPANPSTNKWSKQWNQNHINQTHVKNKIKPNNRSNDQT